MRAILGRVQRWVLAVALLSAVTSILSQPAGAADAVATGLNVITVVYSLDGKTGDGSFQVDDRNHWYERDASGTDIFEFVQIERQQGMVTLYDPTRDVYVYLDVAAQRVMYSVGEDDQTFRRLYSIIRADTGNVTPTVTGMEVRAVAVKAGWPFETFADFGGGTWVQLDSRMKIIAHYVMDTRTNRVLVLRDDSRQLELVFDLPLEVVNGKTAGQPFTQYYSIIKAFR